MLLAMKNMYYARSSDKKLLLEPKKKQNKKVRFEFDDLDEEKPTTKE